MAPPRPAHLLCVTAVLALAASSLAAPAWPLPEFSDALDFARWGIEELGAVINEEVAMRGPGEWEDAHDMYCPNASYFDFIPVYMGHIDVGKPTTMNGTSCFQEYTFTLSMNATGGDIGITTGGSAPSGLCSDFLLFVDRERTLRLVNSNLGPKDSVPISSWVSYEFDDVKANGMDVFVMPCGLLGTVSSALKTVSLFTGTGQSQVQNNIDFLIERKIWQEAVPYNTTQTIDASLIRSGDYLAVARLDGLDPMVMFGTGGHTGHSALLVHHPNGQLYVCESTAANPFGTVYWPPPYGIIMHPYEEWIELAMKANYHLALLPLDDAHSAAFNETAFWQWFETVKGMPYGFHTFLYTFLDTANPMANMPKPIENPGFSYILGLLERLLPNNTKTGAAGPFYSLFMQAMNHRLPVTCPDLHCVYEQIDPTGGTLGSLTAEPEIDGWTYGDGNFSMVCSVFAFHGWKNAFGDFWPSPLEAGEQTPKDNYMTGIFKKDFFNKDNCPTGLRTTPQGTYCQLMGEYVLNLPGYNSVPVHANMNNHCPAQWPSYFRCPEGDPTCC